SASSSSSWPEWTPGRLPPLRRFGSGFQREGRLFGRRAEIGVLGRPGDTHGVEALAEADPEVHVVPEAGTHPEQCLRFLEVDVVGMGVSGRPRLDLHPAAFAEFGDAARDDAPLVPAPCRLPHQPDMSLPAPVVTT